jgi:hypothetical protein
MHYLTIATRWPAWHIGKMQHVALMDRPYQETPFQAGWPDAQGNIYTGGGKADPPHVRRPPRAVFVAQKPPTNDRRQIVGLHNRPVNLWPHKPDRMTKFQRRKWASDFYFFRHGYFSPTDALDRHPTAGDIWAGNGSAVEPGVWP